MKTPITDDYRDCCINPDAWADVCERLELDRAALMEAVDTLTLVIGLTPLKGNVEAMQEAHDIARAALAAARANFPDAE